MCKIRSYYKPFAIIIKFFHASWILMVFVLTIIEIINHDYAIYQAFIIFVTFIFQLLSGKNGACPLTVWENQLYLKYDPSKVYFNFITNDGSFIRHHLKEAFGINAPKGITAGLLILSLSVTIGILMETYL